MIENLTKAIRTYLTGKESQFVFHKVQSPYKGPLGKINLYIHIPFCKNLCPYCPYNKIAYDEGMVLPYLNSLLKEINLYHDLFGKISIDSIYIGGGTPTLLIDELSLILDEIRAKFALNGDICIETNPLEINDSLIAKLKAQNVNLVSLGVQSFQKAYLDFIGRNYQPAIAEESVDKLIKASFKSVNIDLLFALPNQSLKDIIYDLNKAISLGVNQVTTYPLFTFPYSSIGQYLRLKKVRMPNLVVRRKFYYQIYRHLLNNGFNRVSVWGFKKGNVPRYSSVTRTDYLGLGAGAGSHMPAGFYLNTFSVKEYINRCSSNEFPTALFMEFNESMQNYFWFYWRLYDTYVPKSDVYLKFSDDKKITNLFKLFKRLKLIDEKKEHFELTMRGAFWVHLAQNYFSLRYINKVWKAAMNEVYPERIVL